MKIEALTNFCGKLSMTQGEVRGYSDETVVSDLLKAGYVKMAEADDTEKKTKSTTRKAVEVSAGK